MSIPEPSPAAVTISSPSDVVGTIPHLVGFHPSESLVVVCLVGERRRTGQTMRFDLLAPEHDDALAAEVARRVTAAGADAVLLAWYTDAPDDGSGLPRASLAAAVGAAVEAAGIGVAEALLVRDGAWWSYLCDGTCCPAAGTPLADPSRGAAGRLAAERALDGRAVLGSRRELEASVRGPIALRLVQAQQAFERAHDALLHEWAGAGFDAAAERTAQLVRLALEAYECGEFEAADEEVARITLGLSDLDARDDVATMPAETTASYLGLLCELARRTPDGAAAPICTVLGWVAYQRGDGALANVALDRALLNDPTDSMAHLLLDSLEGQVHPKHLRAAAREIQRDLHQRSA